MHTRRSVCRLSFAPRCRSDSLSKLSLKPDYGDARQRLEADLAATRAHNLELSQQRKQRLAAAAQQGRIADAAPVVADTPTFVQLLDDDDSDDNELLGDEPNCSRLSEPSACDNGSLLVDDNDEAVLVTTGVEESKN